MTKPNFSNRSLTENIPDVERFKFEDSGYDFPFYRELHSSISGKQWFFIMVMLALGFAALVAPIPFFQTDIGQLIPASLFLVIPLVGLAVIAPRHWQDIFHKPTTHDLWWMLVFAIAGLALAFPIAMVVTSLFGTNANTAIVDLADKTLFQQLLFFIRTVPQLLGEEVFTMLPFLAMLHYFYTKTELTRKQSIIWAWLISSVIFGLIHLPTYGWSILQCLLVISSARLVLTLVYIKTKNIWVSAGAHIIYDWTMFLLAIMFSGTETAA